MTLPLYLAFTPAEMRSAYASNCLVAWMSCHFSPGGSGLSNIPRNLPEHSLILLDDCQIPSGHDTLQVREELISLCNFLEPDGIVLDFQRPDCKETRNMVKTLSRKLPCPLLVSELYARDADCGVFLSAPPLHIPLEEYLAPWSGREIWLEAALDAEQMTLTAEGCVCSSLSAGPIPQASMEDPLLHCRYRITHTQGQAVFTLIRDKEQLEALLLQAQQLGVSGAVGLFHQLWDLKKASG